MLLVNVWILQAMFLVNDRSLKEMLPVNYRLLQAMLLVNDSILQAIWRLCLWRLQDQIYFVHLISEWFSGYESVGNKVDSRTIWPGFISIHQ